MLKKLSISVKVFGGFLTVLALLVVIGVAGVFSLSASDDAFLDYQNIAAQTNQAGRVQANLLEARLAVKRFILDTSQQNIADVESRAAKTVQFNSELIEMTAATPKWQSIARDTQGMIAQYLDAFEYATRFQFERDKLVAEKLDPLAEQLEQKVTQIMQRAFEKDMPDLAYQAGLVQRNFLLTRLNAVQYIYHYVNEEFFRARREYRELHKNHEKLLADLQDPELKAIALEVRNLQKDYYATLNSVRDLIRARNFIVYKVLDRIGPVVAADLEDLKLEAKGLQDGLGEASGRSIKRSMFVMGVVAVGAVILGVLFAWAIGTGISRPVKMITDAMKQLADGNKALDIPGREHGHEIGEMAAAVEVFKQNMIRADELASREAEESRKQVERGELLDTLAREFDASVSSLLESVSQASSEMMSTADSMSGIASDTSQRGATVAIAAEEASVNVQTVASATEELTSSINEIMRQVEQSSEIAKRAVGQASDTDNQVRGLAVAAEKIGAVISLISDIAEQTNLLALNATIEAARAGEAGKGFAVVAAEVKDLANQTGRATEDIGSQIANIQSVTNEAVDAIKSIAGTISEINEIAASISAAVEQQSTASAEIARNIEEASNGTREVTSNIQEVTQGAEKTKNTAVEVIGVAGGVSDKSAELKSKVEEFLRNVRAA